MPDILNPSALVGKAGFPLIINPTEDGYIPGISLLPAQPLVYRALLTQIGTDAPTAIVLENTLGVPITWVYDSVGVYTATYLYDPNKIMFFTNLNNTGGYYTIMPAATNGTTLDITTYIDGATNGDYDSSNGVLLSTPVEILMYP